MKNIPQIELYDDYVLMAPVSSNEALKKQAEKAGLVLPDTVAEGRALKGIVLRVAENCKKVKPKQKIVFFMYAITEIELEGDKLLIISEKDIIGNLGEVKQAENV
ncbi:hypothetical protein CL633_02385 [bacterium]|nr:hypothetical protein [bacterium]|tara:strand:- start:2089 stop:2403 length:315 start_codon:yes stop_codon:yes gene_type:complete